LAYFPDLSPCTYFGQWAVLPKAVGWLAPEHPFDVGEVDTAFIEKLLELLRDPWQPVVFAGRHACRHCRFSGGPSVVQGLGREVAVGVANLLVPGKGSAYVAPSLIAHYIDAHGYRPPDEFVQAVLDCPVMRSVTYLKAMLELGYSKGS